MLEKLVALNALKAKDDHNGTLKNPLRRWQHGIFSSIGNFKGGEMIFILLMGWSRIIIKRAGSPITPDPSAIHPRFPKFFQTFCYTRLPHIIAHPSYEGQRREYILANGLHIFPFAHNLYHNMSYIPSLVRTPSISLYFTRENRTFGSSPVFCKPSFRANIRSAEQPTELSLPKVVFSRILMYLRLGAVDEVFSSLVLPRLNFFSSSEAV